ncbi:MAG: hypothetical protein QM680_02645 [Luteolibacter sp.]
MKIFAQESYRKSKLVPFVSWKIDSVTTFGDHEIEFHFPERQVIRSDEGHSVVIAEILNGYKGNRLSEFFGMIESEIFVVTKRKMDWLSGLTGNVIFDVTLKDSKMTSSNMVMKYDFYSAFTVSDVIELKLSRGGRNQNYRPRVEGSCMAEYQLLGEVMACLLLHYNEPLDPS